MKQTNKQTNDRVKTSCSSSSSLCKLFARDYSHHMKTCRKHFLSNSWSTYVFFQSLLSEMTLVEAILIIQRGMRYTQSHTNSIIRLQYYISLLYVTRPGSQEVWLSLYIGHVDLRGTSLFFTSAALSLLMFSCFYILC